jgi:TP901 family phage tail tape measure protein
MNIEEVAKLRLEILGDEAEKTIQSLEGGLKSVNSELRLMDLNGEKGSEAWKELKKIQTDSKTEIKELNAALDINNASFRELSNLNRQLSRDLANLKIGSEEWIDKLKEIAQVEGRMSDVREEMKKIKDEGENQKGFWETFKGTFFGAFAADALSNAISAIWEFGKASIQTAATFSDAFGDIQKTTGMTAVEVAALNEALQGINSRTSQLELLDMAKIGGQIGIAKEEIFGFVEAIDKAVVALGDEFSGGAEQVSKELGVLTSLFRETKEMDAGEAILRIGSSINELGAAGLATGPYLSDFTSRLGALGEMAPGIRESLGFGAVLEELGISSEIAASGLTKILVTGANEVEKFASHMNLATTEVRNLINTNPNDFILQLAKSFEGLSTTEVAESMKELGLNSQEAMKVMAALAENTELVAEKQKLSSAAFEAATSLTDEFNIKNNTAAAELEKLEKAVGTLSLDLGNMLMPIVTNVVTGLIAFINTIRSIPEFVSENKEALIALGIALVSLNAANIAAAASSLAHAAAEKGRIIWTKSATAAQLFLNAAMTANPIGLIVAGVSLLVAGLVTLYNNFEGVRTVVDGVWANIKKLASSVGSFFGMLGGEHGKSLDQQQTANQKHLDERGKSEKKTVDQISADNAAANKKTLTDKAKAENDARDKKEKAEQDLRKAEADKNKEAAKKTAAQRVKDNDDALKAIARAETAAIKDDLKRAVANEKAKYKEEKKRVEESKADEGNKAKWLEALKKEHTAKIEKINDDARDKKKKADQDTAQKTDALKAKYQADDLSRETAAIVAGAAKDLLEARKLLTDKDALARMEVAISARTEAEIAAVKEKYRLETAAKEKAARDAKLKEEKTLFDAEFRAFSAKTEAQLANTGDGSNAQLQVKLNSLSQEYAFRQRKLQMEAADEKARVAESIQDTNVRAAALKAIDDTLTAQLRTNDANLQADKSRLLAEQHQNRLTNTNQFFTAVEGLARGDFATFTNLLLAKVTNDQAANDSRLKSFAENGVKSLEIAGQVVLGMQQLNEVYLESKLKKIENEKNSQLKSWTDQYEAGKVSKDEYEEQVARINAEARDRERYEKLKSWRRDQAMQIGMAIINGASAALKSLATMGWPLGLIGVAASAVTTAIQIALIKKQQPPSFAGGGTLPAKSAGYVRNAGVPAGPRHGSAYGKSGIKLVDRETGEERGEMEGGEPIMILSRATYRNNRPVVDKLLHSSLHRNGAPIMYRDGGMYADSPVEAPAFGEMYLFGSRKRKKAAYEADMQAKLDANQNNGYSDDGGSGYEEYSYDASGYEGGDAGGTTATTNVQIQESQDLMKRIAKNTADAAAAINGMSSKLDTTNGILNDIRNKPTGPSLHDIQGAMAASSASASKSNL